MALTQTFIPPEPPKKGGGGLFGDIFGGLGGLLSLAGLVAAPFTGGASLGLTGAAGAAGAAGTAMGAAKAVGDVANAASTASKIGDIASAGAKIAGAGQLAGSLIDPKQPDTGGTPRYGAPIAEVASKRMQQDPRAMVAQLNEGISALKQSSSRTQQLLMPFYLAAKDNLSKTVGQ